MKMLPEELTAVYMSDAHQPQRPVWESSFGRGRHPRTYRRDWGAYVVPVIFAAVIIATVIALVRL